MLHALLFAVLLCASQEVNCDNDNEIASCGNFIKDWFANVQPQTSAAPYVLNVSDSTGKFGMMSWKEPKYASEGVQTGLFLCQVY